jgi:hypothetical protein
LRRFLALTAAMLAFGAVPSLASAATRFVDAETGADADPACTEAAPCQTLGYALVNSDPADQILVDSGTYPEQVTLSNGRSLAFDDFVAGDGTATAIVDGGAGSAVTVAAGGAGQIRDLRLWGNAAGVQLNGPAEVAGNILDDPDATNGAGVNAAAFIDLGSIYDNTIIDPAPSSSRSRGGIQAQLAAGEIRDNEISGMNSGILASAPATGSMVIAGNEITGTHNLPVQGRAIGLGGGAGGILTVRENALSASGPDVIGIAVFDGPVSLLRNEITGQRDGVFLGSDTVGVTLDGDRIWGNTLSGIWAFDTGAGAPQTSATATNVTIVESGAALRLDQSALTLDSSVVDSSSAGSGSTCTITFSRGDTIGGDASGCHDFDTTADPMLVNPAGGDLHLSPDSPMLDAGNPADPTPGALDFDGDVRALDATPACSGNVARRDIGADELAPPLPDCEPPDTTITKAPPKKTKKKRVQFAFESSEPAGATFQCKLDGRPYKPCTSPLTRRVSVGKHKFRVIALDAASNLDPTPAKHAFRRVAG